MKGAYDLYIRVKAYNSVEVEGWNRWCIKCECWWVAGFFWISGNVWYNRDGQTELVIVLWLLLSLSMLEMAP